MKYLSVLFFSLFTLLTSSCNQDDICQPVKDKAPDSEVATLKTYIDANAPDAIKDERGFYYKIVTAGTGKTPNICSTIQINYKGTLTNGSKFDESAGATFRLKSLIKGWQAALPLLKTGGKILLYLPPSFGYGANGSGSIPPNAILIFEIELLGVG